MSETAFAWRLKRVFQIFSLILILKHSKRKATRKEDNYNHLVKKDNDLSKLEKINAYQNICIYFTQGLSLLQ